MNETKFPYFIRTLLLTAALGGFLLWINSQYIFHTALYEEGDLAANSLSVIRAARFHELYGAYSRWGFHHPGPALFYSFALAEGVCGRMFPLVPTPLNAQVIMTVLLNCFFLASGICVAARWINSRLFVPLALVCAALHFTAVNPLACLLSPWPVYVLPMQFFALLIAGASVGAGRGGDLPLLVFAGGFVIHNHIAQPLFVGPIFVLAYVGLGYACYFSPASTQAMSSGAAASTRKIPRAMPWQVFARAHYFATALAVLFAFPIAADLFKGSASNFAKVLLHLRTHHGQRQPWLDSLYCMVRFGGYAPSKFASVTSPQNTTAPEIASFIAGHKEMALLWLGALIAPLLALVSGDVKDRRRPVEFEATSDGNHPGSRLDSRLRFVLWLASMCVLSLGLTVVWNHIQDGEMAYYNSWFTYAIYYALALAGAGSLSVMAETLATRRQRAGVYMNLAAILCVVGAVCFVGGKRARYRLDGDHSNHEQMARTVQEAVSKPARASRAAKLLLFPHAAWETATGVAALLTREGEVCIVSPEWENMFGPDHVSPELFSKICSGGDDGFPLEIWHIIPDKTVAPSRAAPGPLADGYALFTELSPLDPVAGATVEFVGEHSNAAFYAVTGWSDEEPGTDQAWSTGRAGVLRFVPGQIPADASVLMEFRILTPYLPPRMRDAQRLTVEMNGVEVGSLQADAHSPTTLKAFIPAGVWNKSRVATLVLNFPDAISPSQCGDGTDDRLLAFATREIAFHVAGPSQASQQ